MSDFDLWFSRYEGDLYATVAPPGQEPSTLWRTSSVHKAVKSLTAAGHKIVSVGILPPEMLGLE